MRSKAEKLHASGVLAPRLRQQADKLSRRRVAVFSQETGEVVRYVSAAEAIEGVVARQLAEFEVHEGEKPDHAVCEDCGKIHERRPRARFQRCAECRLFRRRETGRATRSRPEYKERENARSRVANLTPEQVEDLRLRWRARYETATDEQIDRERARWRKKQQKKAAAETPGERDARLAYQRAWYAKNRETHKANVRARARAKRESAA